MNPMHLIATLAIFYNSGVGHPAFSGSDEHTIYGMDGA
jgi:hypothetical protein